MNKSVVIGKHVISLDSPIYLIAEVGTTCLGDEDMALELVDAGADAGMDAIKFQLIDPEQVSDTSVNYTVKWEGKETQVNMYEMFSQLQFTSQQWGRIAHRCKERGVDFFATVDYVDGVDLLEEIGVPAHKIGAWDTTFKPLVTRIGQTKKPMLVDLGPTTQQEIDDLKNWYLDAGGTAIIFLHDFHTSEDDEMNLAAIRYLEATQPWPVGYSSPAHDHDLDFLAIGFGARVLEKRLILSRNTKAFHSHESLEPDELRNWVNRIRHVCRAIGTYGIKPSHRDIEDSQKYYRSICTTRPVKAGEAFTPTNLHGKRPGNGIPTKQLETIWGRPAARDLDANILINPEDVI